MDGRSLYGRGVAGGWKLARKSGTGVAVLAGRVELSPEHVSPSGITAIEAARPEGMPLETALADSEPLLIAAARRFARDLL